MHPLRFFSTLVASKWASRQNSIRSLAAFINSVEDVPPEQLSPALLVAVKEHTRGFKETNINVTKAIIELFIAICEYHYRCSTPLGNQAMNDAAAVAVDKIADKKLSALAKGLLSNVCQVSPPFAVVNTVSVKVEKVKSPLPHEEAQIWFKSFCNEYGASSLGNGVKDVVGWILKVPYY